MTRRGWTTRVEETRDGCFEIRVGPFSKRVEAADLAEEIRQLELPHPGRGTVYTQFAKGWKR